MSQRKASAPVKDSDESQGVSIVDARCEYMKNMIQKQGLDHSSRAHLEHYSHLYTKSKKKWQKRLGMVEALDQYIISDRKLYLQQLESERKSFKKKLKTLDANLQAKTDEKVKAKKKEYKKLKRVMSKSDRRAPIEKYRNELQDENAKQHKVMVYRFYHGTMQEELKFLERQRVVVIERSMAVKDVDELTITEQHDLQRKELNANLDYILKKEVKAVTKKAKKKPKLERELAIAVAVDKAYEAHEVITADVTGVMEKRQRREVEGMADIYIKVASLLDVFYKKQNTSLEKAITRAEMRLESLGAKVLTGSEERKEVSVAEINSSAAATDTTATIASAQNSSTLEAPENINTTECSDDSSVQTGIPTEAAATTMSIAAVAVGADGSNEGDTFYDNLTGARTISNRSSSVQPDANSDVGSIASEDNGARGNTGLAVALTEIGDDNLYANASARRLTHSQTTSDGTSDPAHEHRRNTVDSIYPQATQNTDDTSRPANRLYPNLTLPSAHALHAQTFQPTIHPSTEAQYRPSAPALDDTQVAYYDFRGAAYNTFADNGPTHHHHAGIELHQPSSAPDLYSSQPIAPPAYHVLSESPHLPSPLDSGTSSTGDISNTKPTVGRLNTYDELRMAQKAMYARHPQGVLAPSPLPARATSMTDSNATQHAHTNSDGSRGLPSVPTGTAIAMSKTLAVDKQPVEPSTFSTEHIYEVIDKPTGMDRKTPPPIPERSRSDSSRHSRASSTDTKNDADAVTRTTNTDVQIPVKTHTRSSSEVQAARIDKPTPPSRKHSRTSSHSQAATLRATGSYGHGDGAHSPLSITTSGPPKIPPRLSPNTISDVYPSIPKVASLEAAVENK